MTFTNSLTNPFHTLTHKSVPHTHSHICTLTYHFSAGQKVSVLHKFSNGWWVGRIGESAGVFPSTFVVEIELGSKQEVNTTDLFSVSSTSTPSSAPSSTVGSFRSSDVFSNLENIAEVSLSASSSTSMSSPLTPAPAIPRHSKPQLPTATDNGHPISTSSISTPPFTTTTSYLRDMLPEPMMSSQPTSLTPNEEVAFVNDPISSPPRQPIPICRDTKPNLIVEDSKSTQTSTAPILVSRATKPILQGNNEGTTHQVDNMSDISQISPSPLFSTNPFPNITKTTMTITTTLSTSSEACHEDRKW